MFEKLDISKDMVPLALPAMNKHSQNDILFDRSKARVLKPFEVDETNRMLAWIGLPFNTETSLKDFTKIVEIKWKIANKLRWNNIRGFFFRLYFSFFTPLNASIDVRDSILSILRPCEVLLP